MPIENIVCILQSCLYHSDKLATQLYACVHIFTGFKKQNINARTKTNEKLLHYWQQWDVKMHVMQLYVWLATNVVSCQSPQLLSHMVGGESRSSALEIRISEQLAYWSLAAKNPFVDKIWRLYTLPSVRNKPDQSCNNWTSNWNVSVTTTLKHLRSLCRENQFHFPFH